MGKRLLKSALVFIILAGSLYACARNYRLDCTRLESDHINCTRSTLLFDRNLAEEKLDGLVRADVVSCRGYDRDTGYLVELQTQQGKKVALVPNYCYSGRQGRLNTANEINRYLGNPAQNTLTLTTPIDVISLGIILFLEFLFLRAILQEV